VSNKYSSILVISDLHSPYYHKDTVEFLYSVKQKFQPDLVVCIGDEIDGHSWSYHEQNVGLPNPDEEINLAIHKLKPIYYIFPFVKVLNSNHGSLAVRKGQSSKIPSKYISPNKIALEAPDGWQWYDQLDIIMSNNQLVRFHHGLGANAFNSAKELGISLTTGHHHSRLNAHIEYIQALNKTIFSLQVGCLIDDEALSFAYNKTTAKRPTIGCGVIINGVPIPLAMIRDKNNRWVGRKK